MAQVNYSLINTLIDDTSTPSSVEWKKVYCSSVSNAGNIATSTIDSTTYYWRLAGDGNTDDPGTARTITLTKGAQSPLNSSYYNWYGYLVEGYTYALYIDSSLITTQIGIPLYGVNSAIDQASANTHILASADVHGVGSGNDVVGTGTTQTVTNKTLDADNNTISNLRHGDEVDEPTDAHVSSGNIVSTTGTETLTNKTLTDPKINAIANSSNSYKIDIPTPTADDDMALDSDMVTASDFVRELASGSSDANTVSSFIASQLIGSTKFSDMVAYSGYSTVTHAGDPTGNVTPARLLQLCYDSTNDDVYIALGTTSSDWEEITTT